MKLPALQFYPGDWRKDVGVQSLTYHDRGIWFEMLMLMHESERRGVLTLNGRPIPEDSLARLLGLDKQTLTTTITTLINTGVASREEATGALMCRRMVRDEVTRQARAKAGKLGGNPALLKRKRTTEDKQRQTPSSSFSSSSSIIVRGVSLGNRASDPRFAPFKDAYCQHVQEATRLEASWDGREAKALSNLLASSPKLTLEQWTQVLGNRAQSEIPQGERLSRWVSDAMKFYSCPLDRFGKPIGAGNRRLNLKVERYMDDELNALRRREQEIAHEREALAAPTGTIEDFAEVLA